MSSNQLVCIRRPEPSMNTIFENMYLNERLVDVTLSCCDGQLQAHKIILAASSPYFSSLFEKLANPFHYPVIVIKDMNIEDLRSIVDFIYRGQITVSRERMTSLVKSAENLQISGLSSNSTMAPGTDNNNRNGLNSNNNGDITNRTNIQKIKKKKKEPSSSSNLTAFSRNYQIDPDKLLEQSMTTEMDGSGNSMNQFSYSQNHHQQQLLHASSSPSAMSINHLTTSASTDLQQQNLANQFMGQVLNQSLANSKSSSSLAQASSQHNNDHNIGHQNRGRVHPCNICWKTFREKANLKRHLQVHSLDRIVYACPDCNKTFAWKDNYIRHTKTAHHINNSRPQA